MQKYVKMCEDGCAKIFQKSWVNQPNQGHQPWQSNSLGLELCSCTINGPREPWGPRGTPGGTDCLIAKVDGTGQVDLPRIFGKNWPRHLYIFLYIFAYVSSFFYLKLIVDKREAPKAPPTNYLINL